MASAKSFRVISRDPFRFYEVPSQRNPKGRGQERQRKAAMPTDSYFEIAKTVDSSDVLSDLQCNTRNPVEDGDYTQLSTGAKGKYIM
jgi:hypothetical protein